MTSASSRARVGARRDFSGAVSGIVVRYVRAMRSPTAVLRMLDDAGDNRAPRTLEEPTCWSTYDEVVDLFGAAGRILGDPDVGFHLGRAFIGQFESTEIADLVRGTGAMSELLRSAIASLNKMSPIATVDVVDEKGSTAVVRVRTHEPFQRHIYICDFTKGVLSAIPTLLGSGPLKLTELECQARGGRYCRYVLDWAHPSEEIVAVVRKEDERDVLTSTVPVNQVLDDLSEPEPLIGPESDDLSERLEEAYATAADLVATDGVEAVLRRIASRAERSIGASGYVMVVTGPRGRPLQLHSGSVADSDLTDLVTSVLSATASSPGPDVLTVDIESPRNHYGRLACFPTPEGFADDAKDVLAAYAAYAAAALDLASADDQVHRSDESAESLLDFSRALAGAATVDDIAWRLAETVPSVIGSDRSTVMLWDTEEQVLTVRAATGPAAAAAMAGDNPDSRAGYRIERASTVLFERVLHTHEILVVDSSTDDELIRSVLEATDTACSVIAPLFASEEFFGVVLANFDQPPKKDPRADFELQTRLASLADHAVIAMQNTRLLEQVTHLAWHDSLTSLPNRRLLEDRVNQELVRARRNGESTCMFFIDLDRLKEVNDNFGHAAGDDLIRSVASRLVDTVRRQDTVARLGGDEFAVLLPGLADLGDIDTLARRTLDALRRRYTLIGKEVHVSGSIGIAVAPGHGETYDELLSNADAAMYRAKSMGRDTYQLYSVPDGAARPDIQLEVDLKHAVERSEMTVLYQPVVDMRSSEVVGVEALTRWQHPVRGILNPEVFLGIPGDPEVMAGIDAWVVHEACRQMAAWRSKGLGGMPVSVNVTARSLASTTFLESVESAIQTWKIKSGTLELELSNLASLETDSPSRRGINRLAAHGLRFAVDDVGTASAASSGIDAIPVSTLKLESSFVQTVSEDEETAALVSAIVALTSRHGIACVAEGVETQAQARSLLNQGCYLAQGFLFSPPLLPSDVEQVLGVGQDASSRDRPA
ncbi:MAG: EAL domain-containing protein [Acidimicrobiales bacterium]